MAESRVEIIKRKYRKYASIPEADRTDEEKGVHKTLVWILTKVFSQQVFKVAQVTCTYSKCDKTFAARPGKKYCSNSCRVRAWNLRHGKD